jgi:hypothetical protein
MVIARLVVGSWRRGGGQGDIFSPGWLRPPEVGAGGPVACYVGAATPVRERHGYEAVWLR